MYSHHSIQYNEPKRIKDELKNFRNDNDIDEIIHISYNRAIIKGPKDTPYEGCTYNLDITFPKDYPFYPPKIKFATKIHHCNVGLDGSIVGLNILDDEWCPALTIDKVILSLIVFLRYPNLDEPACPEIAKQMKEDYFEFYKTALEMNKMYVESKKEDNKDNQNKIDLMDSINSDNTNNDEILTITTQQKNYK